MNQDNNNRFGKQFSEEPEDEEYDDLHYRKINRKDSNDRREKKKIRKFSKYDY